MAVPIFDEEGVLDRCCGDEALLARIAASFLHHSEGAAMAIREAVHRKDAQALEREAHTLKGAAGNVGAAAAAVAAQRLEDMGASGDLSQAVRALRALKIELRRVRPILTALKETGRVVLGDTASENEGAE